MRSINLTESRLSQIIKEELDLFGFDTSAYDEEQAKKAKRSAAAKKGAETRKNKKVEADKKLDKDMITAFSKDIFSDNPSDKERDAARKRVLNYGEELKKKKESNKKSKKNNKK